MVFPRAAFDLEGKQKSMCKKALVTVKGGTRWVPSVVLQKGPSYLQLVLTVLWGRRSSVAPGKTLGPESVYGNKLMHFARCF